jgi:hypothetical protein
MVLAGQLHHRARQGELAARQAPVTFLERADPRIERGDDPQRPVQLRDQPSSQRAFDPDSK